MYNDSKQCKQKRTTQQTGTHLVTGKTGNKRVSTFLSSALSTCALGPVHGIATSAGNAIVPWTSNYAPPCEANGGTCQTRERLRRVALEVWKYPHTAR